MIDNTEILAKRMKARREELNISVSEIADQTGITRATIYRYESGEIKRIKLPVVESIASILKVNPEWLIGKTDLYKNKTITTEYVELRDRKDIKKIFKGMIEYISAREDLLYDDQQITPEVRLSLITNIEAMTKIIDKLYE